MSNGGWKLNELELESIRQIKCRIATIKHIHFQTDDLFLLKYLRAHDWDIDRAIEAMQKMYATKKKYPDWYAIKTVTDYEELLSQNHRYLLKDRDKHGRRIFVFKLGNSTPETSVQQLAQLDDMWFECMLTEHETQLNGIVVIIDCHKLPWYCLKWCTPKLMRIGADKSDMLPLKNLEIHLVNPSTWLNAIITAVRPVLSKELNAKFKFHKAGSTTLHDFVGQENLPAEYGGPIDKVVDFEYSANYLKSFENFIWTNRQYGIKDK